MVDDFVAPEVVQERMDRARPTLVERSALREARRRGSGGSRRSSSRARRRRDPTCGRAAPGRTSSSTSPPAGRRRVGRRRLVDVRDHRGGAALAARRAASARSRPAPPAPGPHPGRSGVTPTPRARRADRLGQVGAGARSSRAALGDVEIVSLDSMQVYRGWTSAPPSRRRRSGPRCRTTWSTSPTRRRSGRCARTQDGARAAIADIEARGRRALLVGGTGLYVRAVVDDLEIPRDRPGGARRDRRRRRRTTTLAAARTRRLTRARPGRGGAHRAGQPPPHRARARGDRADRPAVLVVRARPRRVPAAGDPGHDARHRGRRRPMLARRIDGAVRRRCARAGLVDEVRALGRRRRVVAHRARGDRLPRGARPPRRRHARPRRRVRRGGAAHPAVRPPPARCGSGAIRACSGSATGRRRSRCCAACRACWHAWRP